MIYLVTFGIMKYYGLYAICGVCVLELKSHTWKSFGQKGCVGAWGGGGAVSLRNER